MGDTLKVQTIEGTVTALGVRQTKQGNPWMTLWIDRRQVVCFPATYSKIKVLVGGLVGSKVKATVVQTPNGLSLQDIDVTPA